MEAERMWGKNGHQREESWVDRMRGWDVWEYV